MPSDSLGLLGSAGEVVLLNTNGCLLKIACCMFHKYNHNHNPNNNQSFLPLLSSIPNPKARNRTSNLEFLTCSVGAAASLLLYERARAEGVLQGSR